MDSAVLELVFKCGSAEGSSKSNINYGTEKCDPFTALETNAEIAVKHGGFRR